MEWWNVIDALSPHARVMTAVVPFILAMVFRLIAGQGRLTSWLISVSTMWFLVNVLLAPYSQGMRQDLISLGGWFR